MDKNLILRDLSPWDEGGLARRDQFIKHQSHFSHNKLSNCFINSIA